VKILSSVYLLSAAALITIMLYKFSDLRRRWGSPRLWSLCALFLFAALTYAFAAPTTISAVNRVTGIENISALIVYSLVVAIAASNLSLGLHWRYPAEQAWPKVRWILAAYAGVIAAMTVLFALSDVPTERRTDFDTYYADQPTVTAFLLLYFLATFIGMASLAYLCLHWANGDPVTGLPWLRRTLFVFAAAALCPATFAAVKIIAVTTAATGTHTLDDLSTAIPALNVLGVIIVVIGLPLPAWGPRLSQWRTFHTLRPLHRAMSAASPGTVMVRPGKRLNPHHRVHRQRIELSDLRWTLARHYDPAIAHTARNYADQTGLSADQLGPVTEAAQLQAALTATHRGQASAPTVTSQHTDVEPQDGTNSDLDWWLTIARAWKSPAVTAVLAQHSSTNTARIEIPEAHSG
jgi:hypothetical protein